MKNIIYIMLMAVSFAIASCTKPFDPGFDEEPVIFLEAFPGADADHVKFRILPAYSKSNTAMMPPFNPVIRFTVNGKDTDVTCIDAESGTYKADHKALPGEKMAITVTSEGFTEIYAETVIPEPFPNRVIDYRYEDYGTRTFNVLYITFEHTDSRCYGIQILHERTSELPSGPQVHTYRYSGSTYSDYYDIVPASMKGMVIDLYGESMSSWNGASFEEGTCTLSLLPTTYGYADMDSYDSFFVQEGESKLYDEEGNEIGIYRYVDRNRLLLYTMTDEFYKYKAAKEMEDSNSGVLGGLAPSNYCYSNVNGGFGAFAGVSCVETDWITKEFIESNR